jgi:hypothetical protein
MLKFLQLGEYPATEVSIELYSHLFSVSLAELNSQLTESPHISSL